MREGGGGGLRLISSSFPRLVPRVQYGVNESCLPIMIEVVVVTGFQHSRLFVGHGYSYCLARQHASDRTKG